MPSFDAIFIATWRTSFDKGGDNVDKISKLSLTSTLLELFEAGTSFPLSVEDHGVVFEITARKKKKLVRRKNASGHEPSLAKKPSLRKRVSGLVLSEDPNKRPIKVCTPVMNAPIRKDVLEIINYWNNLSSRGGKSPNKPLKPLMRSRSLADTHWSKQFSVIHGILVAMLSGTSLREYNIVLEGTHTTRTITRKYTVDEIKIAIDRFIRCIVDSRVLPRDKTNLHKNSVTSFFTGKNFDNFRIPSYLFSHCLEELEELEPLVKHDFKFGKEHIDGMCEMWKAVDPDRVISDRERIIFDKALEFLMPIIKNRTPYGSLRYWVVASFINKNWVNKKPAPAYLLSADFSSKLDQI